MCFSFKRLDTSLIFVRFAYTVLLEFTMLRLMWHLFLTACVLVLLLTLLSHNLVLYFIICGEVFVINFQILFLPYRECFLFL